MTQPSNPAGAQADAARVLVTGANGQIGLRLIERFARANPRVPVRAAVRSERAARTLEALPEEIRPEICIVDYGDTGQIAEAARGCRHAVRLVAYVPGLNSFCKFFARSWAILPLQPPRILI